MDLLILIILSVTFIIIYILRSILKEFRKTKQIVLFTVQNLVLDYYLEKAYAIIYKDRVLIYSLEATRLDDEEFNVVSQDFIRLVIKFMGPTLYDQFLDFYGDEETFMFNVVEYFNTRYENDVIREESLNSLTSDNMMSTEPEG